MKPLSRLLPPVCPLADAIRGKSSAGNLVGTTVKWLRAEGHQFGAAEQEAFLNEVRQLPKGELKKLRSKLSDLAKLVGSELTNAIFEQIIKS